MSAKTIPHLLISFVGKVFKLGAGVKLAFLGVVVATGEVEFVTGLKVNPVAVGLKSEPEDEPVAGGGGGGFVGVEREENIKGAFGIAEGAVVVPNSDEKTSAGQQT